MFSSLFSILALLLYSDLKEFSQDRRSNTEQSNENGEAESQENSVTEIGG